MMTNIRSWGDLEPPFEVCDQATIEHLPQGLASAPGRSEKSGGPWRERCRRNQTQRDHARENDGDHEEVHAVQDGNRGET
jgi:hypothetical protein